MNGNNPHKRCLSCWEETCCFGVPFSLIPQAEIWTQLWPNMASVKKFTVARAEGASECHAYQSRLHRGSSVHAIHSSSRYCPVGTGLITQLSPESVDWTNCNISQKVFDFRLFLTVSVTVTVGSDHSRDQKGESGSRDKPKLQMLAACYGDCYYVKIHLVKGRERWFSGPEHSLLQQRTWIAFPAPTGSSSQLPATPAPEDLAPSSGLCTHQHSRAHDHTHTHIHA